MFLYRHVLEDAIARDHLGKFELLRSTRPKRVPTVLSAAEVARLLVSAARELRDRWLERVNGARAELTESDGKYDLSRTLPTPHAPALLRVLPQAA